MEEQEIIALWKQGYSVEQIVSMNKLVQKTRKNEQVVKLIQNKVEKTILNYQLNSPIIHGLSIC